MPSISNNTVICTNILCYKFQKISGKNESSSRFHVHANKITIWIHYFRFRRFRNQNESKLVDYPIFMHAQITTITGRSTNTTELWGLIEIVHKLPSLNLAMVIAPRFLPFCPQAKRRTFSLFYKSKCGGADELPKVDVWANRLDCIACVSSTYALMNTKQKHLDAW